MKKLIPLLIVLGLTGCATTPSGVAYLDPVPASEAELRPDPEPVTFRDVAGFTVDVMSAAGWFAMEMLKTGAEAAARIAP